MIGYSGMEYKNFNLTPEEIEKGQDDVLREANEILKNASHGRRRAEIAVEAEKDMVWTGRMEEKMLDESSDVFTCVRRGTPREKFFRLVASELPNLGLSVSDTVEIEGKPNSDFVAVTTVPYATDRILLSKITFHPVAVMIAGGTVSLEKGEEMEQKGLIPQGTTKRLLARNYREMIENFKKGNQPEAAEMYEKSLAKLGGITPLSEMEAEDILKNMIHSEWEKELFNRDEEEENNNS